MSTRQIITLMALLLSLSACSWFQKKESTLQSLIEEARVLCQKMDAQTCYSEAQKTLAENTELTDTLALTMFIETCNKADKKISPMACKQAGNMYSKGEGIKNSDAQAVSYFSKACNLDKQTACFQAANAYKQAKGVKADIKKASMYFAYACHFLVPLNANKGKACTQKGLILLKQAQEDEKNIQAIYQGFSFFQKACKNNDAQGCFELGEAYRTGKGVAGSDEYAKQYYRLGCNGEFAESCLWAGNMNAAVNPVDATQYYYTGCSLNNTQACFELAQRYRLGKAISQNLGLAIITYEQICSAKLPAACYWQARLQQQQIQASPKKPEKEQVTKVINAYEQACKQGIELACYHLAMLTQKAKLVKANPSKVAQYLSKICNEKAWIGCFDLAALYEFGEGVVQTPQHSAELYQQVCDVTAETAISQYLQTQARAIAKAQKWQTKACWRLAQMQWQYPEQQEKKEETPFKPVAKDNKVALVYFAKACQLSWLPACLKYAIAADKGIGMKPNTKIANDFYALGCALDKLDKLETAELESKPTLQNKEAQQQQIQSMANSCYNLAVNYRDAIGTNKDTAKANALFKQSCQLNQPWACYNYALVLNKSEASFDYLTQACKLGLVQACTLLEAKHK